MESNIKFEGFDVRYRSFGKGTTVVLIHGFMEDSHVWDYQIHKLEPHCRLMVIDLPGSGKSLPYGENMDVLHTEKVATLEWYANCICAVLEAEDIGSAIIMGHSMGGQIALALLGLKHGLFIGLALVHSTAFADSEQRKSNRLEAIESLEKEGVYPFLKRSIPKLFAPKFLETNIQDVENLIGAGRGFLTVALQNYCRAMMIKPDRAYLLLEVKIPVMFIIGTEDQSVPLEDSLRMSHLPNQAHIHILENVAHFGMWEEKEKVGGFLIDFVKSAETQIRKR